MRKALIAAIFAASMILLSSNALAYLDINADKDTETVYINQIASFDFTLENQRYVEDQVLINIDGDHMEWLQNTYTLIKIGGNSEKRFSLKFYPTGEESGTFHYKITARSFTTDTYETTDFYLVVKWPVEITGLSVNSTPTGLIVSSNLLADSDRRARLTLELFKNGDLVHSYFKDIDVKEGLNPIDTDISLPGRLDAGDYKLTAKIGTTVMTSKSIYFTVTPVHDMVQTEMKKSGALSEEYQIIIYNNGNVPESGYVVDRVVPNNDMITGLITSPSNCIEQGSNKVCKYVLEDIQPGETTMISYRLDYWSIYAQYALILIAITGVFALGIFRAISPSISKTAMKSGDNHNIVIEVKNPFLHNLSNVIVRDWVSPLAAVAHEEIAMVKPFSRSTEAGTELIWKLGDMKPRETRIITYPVKASISGGIKMPSAYIRYNRANGKFTRIFSKQVVLE